MSERPSYLEQALWKQLREARDLPHFCAAWLAIQCSMLPQVDAGVVVLDRLDGGGFTPVARWPDQKATPQSLTTAAEAALAAGQGVMHRVVDSSCLAYPLETDGAQRGVAALSVRGGAEDELAAAMRQLQWGCGWLLARLRQRGDVMFGEQATDNRLAVELGAIVLEAKHLQQAATAVVTQLATSLRSARASLGIRDGKHTKVLAISHSAQVNKHSNLARAIAAAMDESIDQQGEIIYPQSSEDRPMVDRAHAELSEVGGARYLCSVPLFPAGEAFGALTLDRSDVPFTPEQVDSIQRIAAFLGPALVLRYRDDRWIGWKLGESLSHQLQRLFGTGYVGRKLLVTVLAGLVAALTFIDGMWRVNASATVEGAIERVMVAPVAGYITEANARAGDLVEEGEVLFRIDDRDLRLEYLKWSSQKEQVERKLRDALAQHERTEANVLRAQLDQAEAQLTLVGEQISRTRVMAPFDGIVVSGDLTDRLGAPVERGQVIFQIAPVGDYRVTLQVDEGEINAVQVGQTAELLLASMPRDPLPIQISNITPVSSAENGRNTFRVEARLQETPAFLRPGMQGKARIAIERRAQGWIWTHDFVNWLRLWFWSWWP